MTFESDVAAIASRSIWVRARDRAESTGTSVNGILDYDGAAISAGRWDVTGPQVSTSSPPPRSTKSWYFNTASPFSCGLVVMKGIVSFFASSSLSGTHPAMAFNGASDVNDFWANPGASLPAHVGLQFGTGFVSTGYYLWGRTDTPSQTPKDWTFQGSNDSTNGTDGTWTTLDTRSGQTSPNGTHYTFSNSTAYSRYRLNVSAVQSGNLVAISRIEIDGATYRTNHSGSSGEVWIVRKVTGTQSIGPNQTGTTAESYVPLSDGKVYYNVGSSARADNLTMSPAVTWTNWHILRMVKRATGVMELWVDGVLKHSSNTGAASWATTLKLGGSTFTGASNDYQAEIIHFNAELSSGDVTKVTDYLTDTHISAVSPPATTGSGTATAPTPGAEGTGTSTATGSGSATAPAPTGSGTGTSTVTGTGGASAPTPGATGTGTSDDTSIGSGSATAPTPGATGTGTSTVTGSGEATAPTPGGSGSGYVEDGVLSLSAPSPRSASVTSFEVVTAPVVVSDVLLLSAPSPRSANLRIAPVAQPVPAPFNDRPIRCQRHLMPPKTALSSRRVGDVFRSRADGPDENNYAYPVEESALGRLLVFASGIDVTYLTGAPTTVQQWSFAKPFGPQAASFFIPFPEWNEPGIDEMKIFWGDASIELAFEDIEGNLHHLWEGFTGEEDDVAAPGQTGVTWNCEGTFQQAAHWPWDPPLIMPARDVGHVIADALNGVPNRRWAKIKRFTTGVMTETRGDSSQSVLAYVSELIGSTFSDDLQQLRLRRTGPYAYVLEWAQLVVDADWTYTKGSPGFRSQIKRPHNARRDMVFGRGIAPDGGFWMNRKFDGLAAATPPVYPIAGFANMVVGTTDADTIGGNGVSTWQRRMRELGYPVKVDGVMNAADTKWVVEIEQARGISDTGILGPQTWAATWEGGTTIPVTHTWRAPLSIKDNSRPFNYDASGQFVSKNPLFDKRRVLHGMPVVDFGTNIKKSTAIPEARAIRYREASPGYVGSLTATGVDPWEVGSSRLFIVDGDNILVDGHHGSTLMQVSDATHTPTTSRWTVDSGARGQALVDAVLSRQRDARGSLAGKTTKTTDRGTLNASQLGQYESESPAGKYPRTVINGDDGLWTVRQIYVAEQGMARFRLTSSPKAEMVTVICGKEVTPNELAAINANPLASTDGWYDSVEELKEKFALVNVAGSPDDPGGYWPKQKADDAPLTGVQAAGNLSMKSGRGGFFWVGIYTSRSTLVEGEFEPEVPTN